MCPAGTNRGEVAVVVQESLLAFAGYSLQASGSETFSEIGLRDQLGVLLLFYLEAISGLRVGKK